MNATVVEGTGGLLSVTRRPPDQDSFNWTGSTDVRMIAKTRVPGAAYNDATVPIYDGLTWTVPGAGGLRVQAAQLYHRVPCWGYVFQVQGSGSGVGVQGWGEELQSG